MSREVGGYLELELKKGTEYHDEALSLNTGRNAFEYILKAKNIKKIYMPHYTCDVVFEAVEKLGVEVINYSIDKNLDPIIERSVGRKTPFLYTNYFGIKQKTVERLAKIFKNLIVDNSQAFFADPLDDVDSFYSARKFFGVPDGAYLYTDKLLQEDLPQDVSFERMSHLLKRIEFSASDGYSDFKENDNSLIGQPIKKMSNLTKRIMDSIYYDGVTATRKRNFNYLHSKLGSINDLKIDFDKDCVPMAYPFLIKSDCLRNKLIEHNIYVATYWPNVLDEMPESSLEYEFAKYLLPLPIDQRYNIGDVEKIIEIIREI